MASNNELLDTARDYFQFVSRFFEVIKCSAPHIYHSALELSPEDSIVRHHYSQCSLGYHTPHIVCGISRSWDHHAVVYGKYPLHAWSPCGQFLSVQTSTSVEIWDSLTLEKQSSLQLTHAYPYTTFFPELDTLSYSPDGCSLISFFGSAITIWDIQTGGVVKEIECSDIGINPVSLVWSLDGQTIGALFKGGARSWVVCAYDIDLGVKVSTSTLQSLYKPYIWSHNNILQAITILPRKDSQATVHIFDIWPTSINTPTKSFTIPIRLNLAYLWPHMMSFSPATHRISVITNDLPLRTIVILDIQSSKVLLLERGWFSAAACLSPDGSLAAVANASCETSIWKCCPGEGYALWMRFPHESIGEPGGHSHYIFSPTLSSVLISHLTCFEVKHLDNPRIVLHKNKNSCEQFSTDGTYVVTAPCGEQIVTITNLDRIYSQSIKPGFSVNGLALTKNILLVLGDNELAGWCLTEEGMVDGTSSDGVLYQDYRLWTVSGLGQDIQFWDDGGHVGAVCSSGKHIFCYNTQTGEILESVPVEVPLCSAFSWRYFNSGGNDCEDLEPHLNHYYFSEHNGLSEDDLPVSIPWYKGGWVKYPEGKHWHRFWLPVYLRPVWAKAYWFNDITTLQLVRPASGLAIIKFHLGSPLP